MIAIGVDTHKDSHFAVALDQLGQMLGELVIEASATGYRELERWAAGLAGDGQQLFFGIEGAGSYGAGLCEHLQGAGHSVVEVERPRRRDRRAGKSDRIDALAAAKRVLAGEGLSTPRAGDTRAAPGEDTCRQKRHARRARGARRYARLGFALARAGSRGGAL